MHPWSSFFWKLAILDLFLIKWMRKFISLIIFFTIVYFECTCSCNVFNHLQGTWWSFTIFNLFKILWSTDYSLIACIQRNALIFYKNENIWPILNYLLHKLFWCDLKTALKTCFSIIMLLSSWYFSVLPASIVFPLLYMPKNSFVWDRRRYFVRKFFATYQSFA